MHCFVSLCLCLAAVCSLSAAESATGSVRGAAKAGARRALLIGINDYAPKPGTVPARTRIRWQNLDGAVNDAEAMKNILVARFQFAPEDIVLLRNAEASRVNILARFDELIAKSRPGDTAFIFYAGHGSQVRNSKSPEADKKDETIVPADSAAGAPDLRDKELRRLMNALLDRGAKLTAIFDSCHSGSVSRGEPRNPRFLPESTLDAADATDPGPNPKDRGALILSASLDTQPANESTWQGRSHGAFSAALLNVLSSRSGSSSALQLFLRVRALLHSECELQEPVLEASPERLANSLFGDDLASEPQETIVAARSVDVDGKVLLEGGRALGIVEQTELRSENGEVRLQVETVRGLASCLARIIRGRAAEIKPGDLFVVDKWHGAAVDALQVWVPDTAGEYAKIASELRRIAETAGGAVTFSTNQADAHYLLTRRVADDGEGEFAWVMRNADNSSAAALGLPTQSAWIRERNGAARLYEYALRLNRIRTWLRLDPPPGPDTLNFPYELAVREQGARAVGDLKEMKEGRVYQLLLHARPAQLKRGVTPRFVYLVGMDSSGRTRLLYPRSGPEESLLPPRGIAAPEEIALRNIRVTKPLGVDTYILLVSEQMLPDPSILNADGVIEARRGDSPPTPLESLLNSVQAGKRSMEDADPVPENWRVSRLQVLSKP